MPSFKEQFTAFSKFGDTKSDGNTISLAQSDKWMKQAGVFGQRITTTDTGIHFKKISKSAKKFGWSDYNKFLDTMCQSKGVNPDGVRDQMANCGAPGLKMAGTVSTMNTAIESEQFIFLIENMF